MITLVIPLIFSNSSQREFFLNGEGLPCVERVIQTVVTLKITNDVIVIADTPLGLSIALENGLNGRLVTLTEERSENSCLPHGLEIARKWAAKNLDNDQPVMVLSPQAPLLHPKTIEQVILDFMQCNHSVMMSVFIPRDHPSQYSQSLKLIGTERIYILEENTDVVIKPKGSLTDLLYTKPFPFDWISEIGNEPFTGRLYCMQQPSRNMQLAETVPGKCEQIFWQCIDKHQARILFNSNMISTPLERVARGVALVGPENRPEIRIVEDGKSWWLESPGIKCVNNGFARLVLLCADGLAGPARNLELNDLSGGGGFPIPPNDVFGVLNEYFEPVDNGVFDVSIRFLPDETLWCIDSKTHLVTNTESGQPIRGRQDFMDVYSVIGAFFIAYPSVLKKLQNLIGKGEFQPFVLNHDQSLRVENIFDMMLYRARKCKDIPSSHCT